jgi:hypothetical protein
MVFISANLLCDLCPIEVNPAPFPVGWEAGSGRHPTSGSRTVAGLSAS